MTEPGTLKFFLFVVIILGLVLGFWVVVWYGAVKLLSKIKAEKVVPWRPLAITFYTTLVALYASHADFIFTRLPKFLQNIVWSVYPKLFYVFLASCAIIVYTQNIKLKDENKKL